MVDSMVCPKCGIEKPLTGEFFQISSSGYIRYGCRECNRPIDRETCRRFRANNPERSRELGRQSYQRHREARCEYQRQYRRAHADVKRAQRRQERARRRGATGLHTAEDVAQQYQRQRGRCFWCNQRVGDKYHIDHVVPLIEGGSNGPENIVIACPACNLAKNRKHPMDWAGRLL